MMKMMMLMKEKANQLKVNMVIQYQFKSNVDQLDSEK